MCISAIIQDLEIAISFVPGVQVDVLCEAHDSDPISHGALADLIES